MNPPISSEENYYGSFDCEFHNFWTNGSYYCILTGMGLYPEQPLGRLAYRAEAVESSKQLFRRIREQQQVLVNTLPSCHDYLRDFHASARSAERSPVALQIAARG